MPRLVCTQGSNAEEVFAIKEGVTRIGRSPNTGVTLLDQACSREHAEVYRRGDYISIEDLGSRHGTFVNGKRIAHRVKLHVGDRIDIGHSVFKFSEGDGETITTVLPEVPTGEMTTQEISERLLAAELDIVKLQQQRPKVNLFRRLFGDNDEAKDGSDAKDGSEAKGGSEAKDGSEAKGGTETQDGTETQQ